MWAYSLTGIRQLQRIEVTDPKPADLQSGQVLLRVLAGGVCGSDLPFFRGQGTAPAVGCDSEERSLAGFPLHEVVGEVVASLDDHLPMGSRVVGWAEGSLALAEFVVVDGDDLIECDPTIDPAVAVMIQPLACVLSATDRIGSIEGRSVAVLGLGPIGMLFGHVLRSQRAGWITGIDPVDRAEVAASFGFDQTVRSTASRWVPTLTDDRRPAVVVEAVGQQAETLGNAIDTVAAGGLIYYFGIPSRRDYPFDMTTFLRKQLTMAAGTTVERRTYLRRATKYLEIYRNLAQSYVTDIYPVERVQEAFEAACTPASGQLKVTLQMAKPACRSLRPRWNQG